MILIYCLTACLLLLTLLWKYHARYIHLRKKFPYEAIYPIVKYLYRRPGSDDGINFMTELIEKCGDDPVLCLYTKTVLIPTTPKLLQFVLTSTEILNKSDEYNYFNDWFGDGLLTSTGDKWKSHRKFLTQCFHYNTLEKYVRVFDSKSFILVEKLRPYVGRDEVEILDIISLFALDVICETIMGINVNAQENSEMAFVQSAQKLEQLMSQKIATPLSNYLVFRLSSYYNSYTQSLKTVLDFSRNLVNRRKRALMNNQESCNGSECGIRNTLLYSLLKLKVNGRSFTEEEVQEEVDTFISAGFGTTAIAIGFCLYLLSRHPDVQQRAYKEVISVMGKNKKAETTYANLQDMKFLQQVIKESLRLYPPSYLFTRQLNEDIEYDDTILPRGLKIPIVSALIHRNPSYYPDPEKFDPERFSPVEIAKRHPYVYLPFGAGPRNCIGQKFAMLEIKCTIAKLLRHYYIFPAIPEHIVELKYDILMSSKNGIKIGLKERD